MSPSTIRTAALLVCALLVGLTGRGAEAATPPAFALKWMLPPPPSYPASQQHDLAVDALGNVLVLHRDGVEAYDRNGILISRFGSSGSAPGQFTGAYGIGLDTGGNIYVSEVYNQRVQKLTAGVAPLLVFGSFGSGNGQFSSPFDVAAKSDGSIYVADTGNDRVQKFDAAGNYLTQWTEFAGVPLGPDYVISVDAHDNVYVMDSSNGRVIQFDASDSFVRTIPVPPLFALGMAVTPSGHLLLPDTENGTVDVFDMNGSLLYDIGTLGNGDGQFYSPQGVAEDASGIVYVSDRSLHTVQKFVPALVTPAQPTSWGRLKALYH